jgi:hypothetical protein
MGASDTLENQIITRLIDSSGYLFSPDATYYISLHTADPTDVGIAELTPVNGYARASHTTSTGWNAVSGGSTSNLTSITFSAASGGDWAEAQYFGIWNDLSSALVANFVAYGPLASNITCTDGDAVQFLGSASGALTITVT